MTRQKKHVITDMRRKQSGGALIEYTAKVIINDVAPYGGTYTFKFKAEEGLSKEDQYDELFKALHGSLDYNFYYYEAINDDSEGLAVSSTGKAHDWDTAKAGALENMYDADGGRRRRRSQRKSRKAKKLNKRKRKTIRGRK